MDIQTTISVVVIALMVIAFFIYIAWQIKKNGLKEFATQMIVKAEDMYKKGQNDDAYISFIYNGKYKCKLDKFLYSEEGWNLLKRELLLNTR